MSVLVRERTAVGGSQKGADTDRNDHNAPIADKHVPVNSLSATLLQLIPAFVLFPVYQVTRYLLFFAFLLWSFEWLPTRNLGTFVLAYYIFHLLWIMFSPLIFVAIKWIVIGRYKPGRYPIWGSYYLRWWFVDICRKIFLRGFWGSTDFTLKLYYRMLGAKIGRNARIQPDCDVAEFDLVTIGDDAAVESGTLRGFGVDNGAMMLGSVRVGNGSSMGLRSIVAPHTEVPDGENLGPSTSTYDSKALDEKHSQYNRSCLPEPSHWMVYFVGGPIVSLVNAFAQIPPVLVLYFMLQYKRDEDEVFYSWSDLINWLTDPTRIPFYIGIRVARTVLSPFFYMGASILIKYTVIGKFQAGERDVHSQWELLRHWLAAELFSRQHFQDIANIVGRHYELMSFVYRAAGAKVGKRVFWPGRQPVTTGEMDLLEIGDDVVFGSRSSLILTSKKCASRITLNAGSNVADNCVVLPWGTLGQNAVLGSNSVCPEGRYLPAGSVWFGSQGSEAQLLENSSTEKVEDFATNADNSSGEKLKAPRTSSSKRLKMEESESTLSPFGNAVYESDKTTTKNAPYYVIPPWAMLLYCTMVQILTVSFHTFPILASLHTGAAILWGKSNRSYLFAENGYTFGTLYVTILGCFIAFHSVRIVLVLAIELIAKWSLLGRRHAGTFNYDEHSYAQKWELFQLIGKIRQFGGMNYLEYFSGSAMINTYFRLMGSKIGQNCCLYPAGADPYMPEPDLVTIGDGTVVDAASIVCHLNTKGKFALKEIKIGEGCTLRSQSRVQQGVVMNDGAMLVEKSLAMTGEILEEHTIWQGCPASLWKEFPSNLSNTSTPTGSDHDDDDDFNVNDEAQDETVHQTKTSRNV